MKGGRPPVTPAARCERAPLRVRAVSPAGITTQRRSSDFRAQLRPVRLVASAGPTLRQTDTLGGGVSLLHPLSGGARRMIGAASDQSFCFF